MNTIRQKQITAALKNLDNYKPLEVWNKKQDFSEELGEDANHIMNLTDKTELEGKIADLTSGGATKVELKIDEALKIITSEDTTAAIDSWNEVVNFLNEIETVSGSGEITGETLAAILKGLDTRITDNKSKHDSEYKTLKGTVDGHTSKITAVENKANANASAIEKNKIY